MGNADSFLKSHQSSGRRPASHVESGLFTTRSQDTTCAVFGPMHYEARYCYPLIIWLHGEGDDERQLLRVMPHVSIRNYVAVAPRGICLPETVGTDRPEAQREGYRWEQSEAVVQQAEHRIFDGIESVARKYCFHRGRIFLAGFDSGGTMALRVALNHPNRFAGVLSLCGAFPQEGTPLGNLNEARQLPIFMAAGRDSCRYSPKDVCENLRLFHAAGLSVTLRQYPCGHEIVLPMLADVDRWIMEQIVPGQASHVEGGHERTPEVE